MDAGVLRRFIVVSWILLITLYTGMCHGCDFTSSPSDFRTFLTKAVREHLQSPRSPLEVGSSHNDSGCLRPHALTDPYPKFRCPQSQCFYIKHIPLATPPNNRAGASTGPLYQYPNVRASYQHLYVDDPDELSADRGLKKA